MKRSEVLAKALQDGLVDWLSEMHKVTKSIDVSKIEAGGLVSVTLKDGTKVIDSPVENYNGRKCLVYGCVELVDNQGGLGEDVASLDAYTPPKPEWDRPEVFAVKHSNGEIATREHSSWRYRGSLVQSSTLGDDFSVYAVLAPKFKVAGEDKYARTIRQLPECEG